MCLLLVKNLTPGWKHEEEVCASRKTRSLQTGGVPRTNCAGTCEYIKKHRDTSDVGVRLNLNQEALIKEERTSYNPRNVPLIRLFFGKCVIPSRS